MAELKPVPAGYDSAALSSMLGYLANARKQHDNNPGMRVLLDQQARDNLDNYLADADLTRSAQMDDNALSQMLNRAKLIDDMRNNKARIGETVFKESGAITDPMADYAGLDHQANETLQTLLTQNAKNKALAPVKTRADIAHTNAQTENELINAVEGRANVGDLTPIENIHDLPDMVSINPDQSLRTRSAAATGREAAKISNTHEERQQGVGAIARRRSSDGSIEEVPILRSEGKAYQDQGYDIDYNTTSRSDSATHSEQTSVPLKGDKTKQTKKNDGDVSSSKPNVAQIVTDMNEAQQAVATDPALKGGKLKQDEKGPYVDMGDGVKYRIKKD